MNPSFVARRARSPVTRRLPYRWLFALVAALAACEEPTTPTAAQQPERPSSATVPAPASEGRLEATPQGSIALPINQSVSTDSVAFGITQMGKGIDGQFVIGNATNPNAALYAVTSGTGVAGFLQNTKSDNTSPALRVVTFGMGRAGEFIINNANNPTSPIYARTLGLGPAGQFYADARGAGTPAVLIVQDGDGFGLKVEGPGSFSMYRNFAWPAVSGKTYGTGPAGAFHTPALDNTSPTVKATTYGRGPAGSFEIHSAGSSSPAIVAKTVGAGPALTAYVSGTGRGASLHIANSGSAGAALYSRTDGTGWAGEFRGTSNGVRIITSSGAGLQVLGGSKQAVVATPSGGRSLYTEESAEVWFTDYGFGRLEDGRARILLDPVFAQTIASEAPYHVFVQSYGDADLSVRERTALGFVVVFRGGTDRAAEFSYRVVAKRRGFERTRLEPAPWADRVPDEEAAPGVAPR